MKMMRQLTIKTLLVGAFTSVLFTGCGFSTKVTGINNNLNVQHLDSLANEGLGYNVSMSYIGQVELNDKNVEIINKSIQELYESIKSLDTYTSQSYDVLVDKCKTVQPKGLLNMSYTNTSRAIERECRKIYEQNGNDSIQNQKRENRQGFLVQKIPYPKYYSISLKNQRTGVMYNTNKPLVTGISNSIKITDYRVELDLWDAKVPFQSHISFIPIDSKINIFFNYTSLKSPKNLIKFTPELEDVKLKMVAIKNELYIILEKNGLKIDEEKEVSFSDFDLSTYAFGIHKVIN